MGPSSLYSGCRTTNTSLRFHRLAQENKWLVVSLGPLRVHRTRRESRHGTIAARRQPMLVDRYGLACFTFVARQRLGRMSESTYRATRHICYQHRHM
eukprot:scaffold32200_cov27-Tisochrysis_lutea.AAC.1